jgi:transcriptional regulator with XRE-family HTH domain
MGNTFKENLREELEFNGISVKELAIQANIPRRSIDNYLSARQSMPPADYACRIARVLNTTVEELVGETTNQKNDEKVKQNARIITMLEKIKSEDKKAFLQLLVSLSEK